MSNTRIREVGVLLDNASLRIITDYEISRGEKLGDFDMVLQRLQELNGYMHNRSEFMKLEETTRFKSMDAAGVLARTGYL